VFSLSSADLECAKSSLYDRKRVKRMSKKEKQSAPEQPKKEKLSLDGNYPGLNGISWGIGYLEQTLSVISEPLLLVCAAIAVIDSITGGHLMEIGLINYTWAAALAIAVTACFIVTWRRSFRAFGYNRYGAGIGLAFLGSLLGLVDLAAIAIQALQQTLNISFAQALAMLNLNIVVMTYIRSFVAIAMAVVVAVSNNTAVTAAQAPKRRLAFLEKALDTLASVVSDETAQPAQTVITPSTEQEVEQRVPKQSARLHIVEPSTDGQPLERVKRVLSVEPDCSDRRLGALTNLAPATAKKYRQMLHQQRSEVKS
jgi:hypothetical protein